MDFYYSYFISIFYTVIMVDNSFFFFLNRKRFAFAKKQAIYLLFIVQWRKFIDDALQNISSSREKWKDSI